jgi:hypothetical protein
VATPTVMLPEVVLGWCSSGLRTLGELAASTARKAKQRKWKTARLVLVVEP